MKRGDLLFWIWLSEALGNSGKDFRELIAMYESPYNLFHVESSEAERIPGISDKSRRALMEKNLSHAASILEACEKNGIGILTFDADEYPNALRELKHPPILLYYQGKIPDFNHRLSIAMVGTRRMSAYGLQSAYRISYELATANALTISGMASGIDGVCAAATIAAGGQTVAVLGCGLDIVYPPHHKKLMDEIRKTGLLLSEYAPGTLPSQYHFPVRNRVISGLSQGTVVVEAGMGSGSLITAKEAVMQGRDVFAVPANIGENLSEGTNQLIHDGANVVLEAVDILEPYRYVYTETLMPEKIPAVKGRSKADLHYLADLGVIQLTPAKERKGAPPTAPTEPAAPAAGKRPSPESKAAPPSSAAPPAGNVPKAVTDKQPPAGAREPRDGMGNPNPVSKPKETPDAILSALSPAQLALLRAIPDDQAIPMDALASAEFPISEVSAALTMLEIMGLIQKLPGGMYTKT